MIWQNVVAALAAKRIGRLLVRLGLPALAGALAAIAAELPPELAEALANRLCASY